MPARPAGCRWEEKAAAEAGGPIGRRRADAGARLLLSLFSGLMPGDGRAHARRMDGAPLGVCKAPAHVHAAPDANALGATGGRAVRAGPSGPPAGRNVSAADAARVRHPYFSLLAGRGLPARRSAVARIARLPARVGAVPEDAARRRKPPAALGACGRPVVWRGGPRRDALAAARIPPFTAGFRAVQGGGRPRRPRRPRRRSHPLPSPRRLSTLTPICPQSCVNYTIV